LLVSSAKRVALASGLGIGWSVWLGLCLSLGVVGAPGCSGSSGPQGEIKGMSPGDYRDKADEDLVKNAPKKLKGAAAAKRQRR